MIKIHFYSVSLKIKLILFMKTCNLKFPTLYTFTENMQYIDERTEYVFVFINLVSISSICRKSGWITLWPSIVLVVC